MMRQYDRVLVGRIADHERSRFSAYAAGAAEMINAKINATNRMAPPMDCPSVPGADGAHNGNPRRESEGANEDALRLISFMDALFFVIATTALIDDVVSVQNRH
jgi:hypothetical protein